MHQVSPVICDEPAMPADTSWRSRQLAALSRFNAFARQESDLEFILQEACRSAATGVEAKFAAMLQYREDEQAFVLQAGFGLQARLFGRAKIAADLETTGDSPGIPVSQYASVILE